MSISAPVQSNQYVSYSTKPVVEVFSSDWGSKLRASMCKLTFTAAGFTTAAAGDIKLIRMPPGKVRILSNLCRIVSPAGTSTADLDGGYGAYTKNDGTAGAASNNAFFDSLDVGGGAIDSAFTLPTAKGFVEIESQNGFDIVCSYDTANSPASGDLYCIVVYMMGN